MDQKTFFRRELMDWYQPDDRPMPWKESKDIYHIWLSEIMLQQTRVDQMLPYFQRFVSRFPRLESLAAASEEEVLYLWQGLGYYSRARNLHKAAQMIVGEWGGEMPDNLKNWLAVPGVGPYTAAAITSFAFGQPNAVLDGNVFRLLSRYFGVEVPMDSSKGKKIFSKLAGELISQIEPGRYNQAVMDFGATVCTPASPKCHHCPLAAHCIAFQSGKVDKFPVRSRKVRKKKWKITYCHLFDGDRLLLVKRPSEGIWGGLYDLPVLPERENPLQWAGNFFADGLAKIVGEVELKHQLTHRSVEARIFQIEGSALRKPESGQFVLASYEKLPNFALHSLMKKYFTIFTSD